MNETMTVALVGNPNCGKTTLFNALTGSRQKVGNWPGVTVEQKIGQCFAAGQQIEIVDLPGIYTLTNCSDEQSIDVKIACQYILNHQADFIINIVDATNLERNFYLTTQLLAMGLKMLVVVNMLDVAKKNHLSIDLNKLSQELGCPVVGVIANKKNGIADLKEKLVHYHATAKNSPPEIFSPQLKTGVDELSQYIMQHHPEQQSIANIAAQFLLQGDAFIKTKFNQQTQNHSMCLQKKIESELKEDIDIIFADNYYSFAHQIVSRCITQKTASISNTSQVIDNIVLNRFLGIPIFLLVMYSMFFFAINVGGVFQDFFDIASEAIFVNGLSELLQKIYVPQWLIAILASGAGKGINTTISFVPVIGSMFLFLSFLEASGYMARAAFVVDKLMQFLKLPGKAFVPMIVGFGCNVPAIMAARTLENSRDRALTILMSPFMSCGARLAIYSVFVTAFFPVGGQNVVFSLYCIGIIMAILTGFLLRKTLLKGNPIPLVLELPPYHIPTLRALLTSAWHRLKEFVIRAGMLIVPICMLIGSLNSITVTSPITNESSSLLAKIGQAVTPVFAPMGIKEDNWPAAVGLMTGVLAKEVVVATLNTLYMQQNHINVKENSSSLKNQLKLAIYSIPNNLVDLKNSFSNPFLASAPDHNMNNSVYGIMYERFGGPINAFAYLLFVLLYFPCISATAAMLKELNKYWAVFSVVWMTGVAYGVSVLFYQVTTFSLHPVDSILWTIILLSLFFVTLLSLKRYKSIKIQYG